MEEFNRYCVETKPENYDTVRLRRLIDRFAPKLMEHLKAEIPIIMGLRGHGEEVSRRGRAHDWFYNSIKLFTLMRFGLLLRQILLIAV